MLRLRTTLLALFLAACASGPQQASTDAPFATIEFEKGYSTGANATSRATIQEYTTSPDGRCATRERIAAFTWVNGGITQFRAAAAEPFLVYANTTYYRDGMQVRGACTAWAAFVPEAGHTYRVVQTELSFGVCELRVVDQQLAQPPRDLRISNEGCPYPTSP